MIAYDKKEIIFNGCPGCAYGNHEFSLSCGIAFENDKFVVSQDWEVPIKGFMIISPKRHVNKMIELNKQEKVELFSLIDNINQILYNNQIADTFVVTFEEREDIHFHACILPRHEWMKKIARHVADNFIQIADFAKQTFTTAKYYDEIKAVSMLVGEGLKQIEKF